MIDSAEDLHPVRANLCFQSVHRFLWSELAPNARQPFHVHRNRIFAIMPLSSCFRRWQWKSDMPRMIGSVKSITKSTELPKGTFTVSSHTGSFTGFPSTAYVRKWT